MVTSEESIRVRLREARKQQRRTQDDVAETLGLNSRTWQRYSTKPYKMPLRVFIAAAEYLNTDIAWLAHGHITKDKPNAKIFS